MNENKHTPDIKCYRINYNSKYWANVAAKVGNQCSSPVGAVFAVNALCDAYEDIAKQRDELLAALEEALPMVPCGSFDDYHLGLMATDRHMTAKMILRLRKLIASVKGEQ